MKVTELTCLMGWPEMPAGGCACSLGVRLASPGAVPAKLEELL